MTEMRGTAPVATETGTRPAAARPAPARQAPADLTVEFVTEPTVRQIATLGSEPEWLLADRLAALGEFEALPIETNQLYTPYVDLRNAQLAGVVPYLEPQRRPLAE